VVKTERSVNSKDVNYKSIKNLDLQFSFLDKKNSDLLFSFYDAEENMELNGEIQTIEKWAKIVNNHLKP